MTPPTCPRCGTVCAAATEPAHPSPFPQVRPSRQWLDLPEEAEGRGVILGIVDAAFYPHPDLTRPSNRIRAWADASFDPVRFGTFQPGEIPRWPGWDLRAGQQWHGLMCSAVAAGNGWMSHGLYAGPARAADVVLVQTRQKDGRIGNATIARALRWLADRGVDLGVRVVSISVGGDAVKGEAALVHDAVMDLAGRGVLVLAASGNDGRPRLRPPASSAAALTIGGYEPRAVQAGGPVLWRSSWGRSETGAAKPEVVAPSAWIPAPILPETPQADRARSLWEAGDSESLAREKYLTPHEHHVDGTSVAVSLAAGAAACLLEARPDLDAGDLESLLVSTAAPLPGPRSRQGAGAIRPRLALERARSGAYWSR